MVAVIILVAVIGILALLGYVVYKIDLKRFRASGELGWKQVKFSFEADSESKPGEEPEGSNRALPESKRTGR